MSKEITFVINFNRVEIDSWIDKKPSKRGGYDLIGMGRRTEYDYKTGAVVSEKIEPTGITGWAPSGVFAETSSNVPWWRRMIR